MKDKLPKEIKELIYTLQEICRLAYLKSQERSPKSILRLHNVTFQHANLCFQIFGKSPQKLQKMYGIYFHANINHLPIVARIISPSSLDTESEERIFGALRGITLATSSRSSDSIRDTGIIRFVFAINEYLFPGAN